MLQQVNLYKLLPRKKASLLTKKFVVRTYVLFFAFLTFLYLHNEWKNYQLNKQLAVQTKQNESMQQQLIVLAQQYPFVDVEALKKNIEQLQQDYDKKSEIIEILSPYANFSNFLVALGNTNVVGVWLTEIIFNRNDTNIELKGYTVDPASLEDFFAQLTRLPNFAHYRFKINEVKQNNFPAFFYITGKQVTKL